jgi:predicted flap endonuclease-1-like 5' DNA nuclease
LDDYTAIDGVGPAYAQKLHDLGLYTYEDLRAWLADRTYLEGFLPDHTVDKIRAWLAARLM